ncbi:trigger factor [Brevibacillus sp. 7WMA2]|uniref:Trigger factor n=1 Tax=Brevibacillus laterosporus LMG 15441 TaxID=1042163 RepID=A0A075R2X6_BRELA|nr:MULTISPECIES: trigger factor [Brevibacillus]AIG25553.1 trigger factor [Brevibacillus laterosporus LMG 15441]AUM64112.1 trigger factor [Brevibacillus laterosporus]AYK07096.1 trigger factor [Brevibacillus laterosporus]ERM19911.1 trigger factor [Brevibacillus laterosporus PE36]MCR8994090.1 trigger factor [Brevibacillus laterosporus]
MVAKWEKLENNQGVLTVEVDADQVNLALDEAFKKVVKKVNVPGFRKGKVPRKMFENRFGVESLYQDALDIILPQAYGQAVRETGIEPVDRPEVDVEQMEAGQKLVFKATVTVKPEVKLGDYKGLSVEEKDFTVGEEQVAEELKGMQTRHAELVTVEEGPAENGDSANIDFEGFQDGVAFEGGKAEDYALELGTGTFIAGFEEQVVGMKIGEEKEITVTFPEEYHSPNLAGKEAMFKVKLNSLKRKNLPELDDEFAKDVSEFDTLEEYKADLKAKLEEKAEAEKKNYIREQLVLKATENAEIDIPDVMVESELDQMVKEFEQRLQMQGMNLELYYQFSGTDESALRDQMRKDAVLRVRTALVLEAIAKTENLETKEEDVDQELEQYAKMYGRPADELKKIFAAQDGLAGLFREILTRKVVDLLVAESK